MRSLVLQSSASETLPVYRQIAQQIRSQIDAGELVHGARLPPIRALSQELGVNRDTVALAYEALATEGLIESTVGRGTFVSRPGVDASHQSHVEPEFTPQVERLMRLANTMPRFGVGGVGGDAVSLHSLIPDPSFYPVDEFRRAFNRVVSQQGADIFLYGTPQGHLGLREVLAERFGKSGMSTSADNIILCHGASQGISLALRVFAQPGQAVAVEAPTYHNVLGTLAGLGVKAIPIPTGEDGPDLAVLARVLARPDVKAFYTIPTFHNPLGITTKLTHRRALLEIASRCGVSVLEDAFEMDLRFAGKAVPSLAALDTTGIVVHLFSFSKSLFPGVRVGSITASDRVVPALVALKQSTDLSDSLPLQGALAAYVGEGGYDRHLGRLRRVLRARRDAMLEALAEHMPANTRWTSPEGGYQVWVELPFEIDTRDLLTDSARAGVLFAPGSQFAPEGGASRAMRLTIAQADESAIRRGVRLLAGVLKEHVGTERAARQVASVHL